MPPKLIVASAADVWEDDKIPTNMLDRGGMYKMLSLVEAHRAGLPIPPSALLLEMDTKRLDYLLSRWRLPLMVRMDFKSLPSQKPLGGILLYSRKSLRAVAKFIFDQKCCPMFHPRFDRFKNVYSAGILIHPNRFDVRIEIVGNGFDASDLRLGNITPHESFVLDLLSHSISDRWMISEEEYVRAKESRVEKVKRLQKYIRFVNEKHVLLPSLDAFAGDRHDKTEEEAFIADSYCPLPPRLLRSLQEIAWLAQTDVVKKLPESDTFVASLSYFEDQGWMLWDIYGQWYKRG
jgi:hypothetical protein